MANTFGRLFKVTTFGESHGVALGCVIDGCPAGLYLDEEIIQALLDRRKPGQNLFTTERAESDKCEIISGTENSVTLGTPITIIIRNQDKKPRDYSQLENIFRPGHADYTTKIKYGLTSKSGGGRASARETVGRVAASAVAKAYLQSIFPAINVMAWVQRISNINAHVNHSDLIIENIEKSEIRCPDSNASELMKRAILSAKEQGDSLGGVIRCVASSVPTGIGEPVFDKLEAELAKAMLSIPASKSFEIGNGLDATYLMGSENNDPFYINNEGKILTKSNRSGGIQGGISNGMPIEFSVGFKPISTIYKEQETVTKQNPTEIKFSIPQGRHDPCVLPRAVPIVEAMCWLVLADQFMLQNFREIYDKHHFK
ncbi:chorismate synthase [Fluviispira multicolorata]|uniref:Chorismate synthase n=1 Tax=Fluviispira multicolorata TaxID=2654512 RepID=A0A833JF45_9BACT|nr:chorismate synthase [Fluviispira multicolorata]KAB8033546.1 chorismate synthase [Fluviispira multicolorata]